MKQDKAVYTFGTWSVGVLLGLAACAGGDTPARTPELVEQIAVMYAGAEPTGAAAAGGSGAGAMTGSGGSQASGSGGSTVVGNAGAGGGSSSDACDGFAILKVKCSGGPCHDQQNSGPDSLSNFVLDESTAKAFEGEQSAKCASTDNAPVFDSQNPASSLVVKKITGTASCGGRMPLGAPTQALSDDELTCVKTWIGTLSE